MHNPEKVIKGLKCCAAMSGDECSKCPYGAECRDTDLPYGMPHLASDALALLKKQEEQIDTQRKNLMILLNEPKIVRCKDCINGYQCEFDVRCENPHKPSMYGQHFPNDWFCHDGER